MNALQTMDIVQQFVTTHQDPLIAVARKIIDGAKQKRNVKVGHQQVLLFTWFTGRDKMQLEEQERCSLVPVKLYYKIYPSEQLSNVTKFSTFPSLPDLSPQTIKEYD